MIINMSRYIYIFILLVCGTLYCDAQGLKEVINQRQQEIEQMKEEEKAAYELACRVGTVIAYNEFLDDYPESEYAEDINNRIKEHDLWSAACTTNTIAAYQNYLDNSKFKSYEKAAKDSIKELQSVEAWNKAKASKNLDTVLAFVSTYPNSSKLSEANLIIHQLKGVKYYNEGNLSSAYDEFKLAGGKSALENSNQALYDKAFEYHEYKSVIEKPTESGLVSFMSTYPSSQYYNEVSNKLAILKAKNLNKYSTDDAYNGALVLAKDNATRAVVENYISQAKKDRAEYKSYLKRKEWRENGGLINMSFEFLDLGVNAICPNSKRGCNIAYYNMGIGFRIGNYSHRAQFEIGVRPGVIAIDENDKDKYELSEDAKVKFHMPVYAKLKLNIAGRGSKFYIFGEFQYNAIRVEAIERQFGYKAGLGIQSRNWDWSLYYKNEFGDYDWASGAGSQYIGTSVVRYFRIF